MRLVIRAQRLSQDSPSQAIIGEFDDRGGTIGRSESNTITLPDPERHVSRLQAEVSCAAGFYSLRNVGGSNPIIVNGRPLGPGEAVALRHQDRLLMGGYELHVELDATDAARDTTLVTPAVGPQTAAGASMHKEPAGPPWQPAAAAALPKAAGDDPFAGLLGADRIDDKDGPFGDLLVAPASVPRSVSPHGENAEPRAAGAARLPEDFDPFAEPTTEPPASRATPSAAAAAGPLHGLLGPGASTPGISTMFGLKDMGAKSAEPLADFLGANEALPPTREEGDAFAFLRRSDTPNPQGIGPAAADHTPVLNAAFKPPPVRVAAPAPAAKAVAAPAEQAHPSTAAASDEELWAAFCEGAQVSLPSARTLTPELMRLIGSTLHHAVEGTLRLNSMRATVKQELHVALTMIQPRGNNPLKFAPDATAALVQMLQPPMRGFMPAAEAMRDAMDDLIGHSLGTMEGTRAALRGVLERFEPKRLEERLADVGILDRLVPMSRRSRLWSRYLRHYARIAESASEDFDDLFGKAFAKAYEEHIQRVAAARRTSP